MATKTQKIVILGRPLYIIANEIRKDWKTMPEYARAHFEAFEYAHTIDQMYGCDSVKSEVNYFLASASSWRGEVAKRIKAELKQLTGTK